MIITTCGNSTNIARKVAKELKAKFSPLAIGAFPDGDLYLKYNTEVKGQTVVIIQSFQPHPDQSLFDSIFAAETARDLGAKKVILVAPYLAYMRQDKRFNPGECVSSKVMAKLINNSFDKLITVDPHIHRYKSLKDIFTIPTIKLTSNPLIGEYVRRHFKKEVIIGPDWESYQWAEDIAKHIHVHATVLKKTRFNSRHVSVQMIHPIDVRGMNAVIVDDIISTGHTIIEAAKDARRKGAKKIYAIGVHGLLVEGAAEKLKKQGIDVITTNCIEHPSNKIDVTPILVEALKKEK